MVIETMAAQGKEPTFCMGDDIPLAVLSRRPHMLYDYFKQRFAQVCTIFMRILSTLSTVLPSVDVVVSDWYMNLCLMRHVISPQ